ncbi:hypothetical protein [Streptomyces resistomycificus]|uniref:Membrane protein n=1 Tax=Streptomyces resistomycificus TaxID=67356 RepID=A0A0L8L1E4_9ACTN|nr:hypothetical protein [Streptomyces resistomycificus]KOG31987.1 membrane protein [Streptomyces resistomycificus]KUO00498.1 hypothetical protein AQJ84_05650 [Streptomyces resistomycificus]
MWPGQQPPGGGQDPQQHPAEKNPYQQPGYHQANPYAGQPQPWDAPTLVPAPPGGGRRTKVVAISVAAAVVLASAVTGAVLLGGGSDDEAGPGPTTSPASASPSPSGNPRAADGMKPTVAGWKVVVNPDLGVAFDVPSDWAPQSTGWVSWVSENDDPQDKPLVAMKAPAYLKEEWCGSDDDKDGEKDYTSLAAVGTRGNNGAKSTEAIARTDSSTWVYGGYTQPDRKKVTTGPVTSFTTTSGLTGSTATSRSSGAVRKDKCDTEGKATTFAFTNTDGDFASWSLVGVAGVDDEVPDATVREIMKTVRLYTPPST